MTDTTELTGASASAGMQLSDRALRRWSRVVPVALMLTAAISVALPGGGQQSDSEGVGKLGFVVIILIFPLTGAAILRSQPRNRVGWLLEGIGLVWLVGAATDSYATLDVLLGSGSLPGAGVAAAVNGGIWAPGLGLTGTFLFLVYPDGRLPSRRWRPVAWLSATAVTLLTLTLLLTPGPMTTSPDPTRQNPLGWESAEGALGAALGVLLVVLPVCMLLCASALVVRFRRSHGIERLQLKWLAAAGAVVAVTFLGAIFVPLLVGMLRPSDPSPAWLGVFDTLSLLSFLLLPVAIAVAILKHRLYEIDVVIKRTLVYTLLTATLVGAYLGGVLLLQLVLSPLASDSDLAVAGSTLVVAGLFGPARRRIQRVVDRRFNRRRYDPTATLDAFATGLRHELDVDAVGSQLVAAATQTLEPSGVSLWLRP
ncbi:MAG: hypothetical protein ABIQ61_01700 [Ornithinibacter sp.]